MRYNRQLKKIIGLSLIPIAIITIIFSYLQIIYKDIAVYAILNNVFICILTGGIVTFIQAVIGYRNSKRDIILAFYKDLMVIEYKIGHYPYNRIGFKNAIDALPDVMNIILTFSSNVTFSYTQIVFSEKNNSVLDVVKSLYKIYGKQVKAFQDLDDELCEAIRFIDASEEDLLKEGITDVRSENIRVNNKLQAKAEIIRDLYNSEEDRKARDEGFAILEQYLFKQKVK